MFASYSMSDVQYEYPDNPSISSVDTDLGDARKLLQAQLASLFPAVFRLPDELVYFIFVFLASEDNVTQDGDLGWMRVTHVCRRWRLVALRNPTLWWDLHFKLGKQWANTIVARSQGVPLEITSVALSEEEYEYIGPIIRKTMHRATLLWISVPHALSRPLPLDDILVCPAPLLDNFELSYDFHNLSLPFIPDGSTPYRLPAAFLDHANCPRLDRLSLSGCTLPLGAHLDLSELSLYHLSTDDILPFFQLLPQLEALSFLVVHFHRSAVLHEQEEKWYELDLMLKPFDMPHLETITFRGRNPECSAFMANVVPPRLCSFHMDCAITGSPDEFREALGTMERFIGHSSITANDHACVSGSVSMPEDESEIDYGYYNCRISVSSESELLTPEDDYLISSAAISVKFTWSDRPTRSSLLEFAAEACHATRLGDVRTLDLDLTENYMFHEEVLSSIVPLVQTLKSLRSLSIQDSAGVDVDVSGMLRGTGFLRIHDDWTKVGNHWDVVRSAVPETFGEPGTPTILTPIPRAPLPIDVDHWVPYSFPTEYTFDNA